MAFVVVEPAFEDENAPAGPIGQRQPAAMAGNGGAVQTGDVGKGDAANGASSVSDTVSAAAEDDSGGNGTFAGSVGEFSKGE